MGKSKLFLMSISAMATLSLVAGLTFAAAGGSDSKPAKPAKQAGSGTVTAISGSTITLQGKKGIVTIDASKAKVITISTSGEGRPNVATINLSDIKLGDTLRIQGAKNGASVTATQIVDVTLGGGGMALGLGNQPPKGSEGLRPQGEGDQGKPENPTKCMDTCKENGTSCIAQVENTLKKQCDSDGQACRASCDAQQLNGATVTRACYENCRPAEVACYDKVVALESACTTTKDQCVTACQKASKPDKPNKPLPNDQQDPGAPNNCPSVGGGMGRGGEGPNGQMPGGQNEGPNGRMPMQPAPMSQDAENAIANKDFAAWVKAMTASGGMPEPLKVITQDNFAKFAEAHGYQLQAKVLTEKAAAILKALGITEGPGLGNDQGQGQ